MTISSGEPRRYRDPYISTQAEAEKLAIEACQLLNNYPGELDSSESVPPNKGLDALHPKRKRTEIRTCYDPSI